MTSTPISTRRVDLLGVALNELEEAGAELDAHVSEDACLARPAGRVVQAIAAALAAGRSLIRATRGEE